MLAIVHAANVGDGAVLAATHEVAGGRAYNLDERLRRDVREFLRARRPRDSAAAFDSCRFRRRSRAARSAPCGSARDYVTGGRMNVLSNASLALLTETIRSRRTRAAASSDGRRVVRSADGIPDAFRWWAARTRASR